MFYTNCQTLQISLYESCIMPIFDPCFRRLGPQSTQVRHGLATLLSFARRECSQSTGFLQRPFVEIQGGVRMNQILEIR